MPRWFQGNSLSIGRMPLIRLNRVIDGGRASVLAILVVLRDARPSRGMSRSTMGREFDHDLAIFGSKLVERSASRPGVAKTLARGDRQFGRYDFRYPGCERQMAIRRSRATCDFPAKAVNAN